MFLSKWGYQYAQNKNLKNSIKTSQIAEVFRVSGTNVSGAIFL